MKTRAFLPFVLAAALPVCAQAAPSETPESVARAATTVQQDLEAGLKQLSALRETILAEKEPMTRELNQLEERLSELRRQHETASRALDNRNLELANLRNEIKVNQDEANYLSNLMDEYARGFESRVHVSEIERYTPLVEAAKAAPQNVDLSLTEKFQRQLMIVKASVARIEDLIGGARFDGSAVDPQGRIAEGKFALIGPVALFASADGRYAGLALAQAGSTKPAVRPLEKHMPSGMNNILASGEGMMPLDPTRGGALKELINRGSLIGYFKKGGPIMWPLLFCSLLGVTVVIERMLFLYRVTRKRNLEAIQGIFGQLENGDVEGAIKAGKGSEDFVARALTYALMYREKSLSDALIRSSSQELVRFTRGIPFLDTIVTMAPLLGLLGTVTGMMASFGMLGGAELSSPAAITGGIAEALIATCFGLGIAIACLIPLNMLRTRSDEARHEMEDACTHLELLMKPILEAESVLGQRSRGTSAPKPATPEHGKAA